MSTKKPQLAGQHGASAKGTAISGASRIIPDFVLVFQTMDEHERRKERRD
jgi:hypothetical protein